MFWSRPLSVSTTAVALTVLTPACPKANDWSISSFFEQRFGADTNLTLEDNDDNGGLRGTSRTSLGAVIELERQTARWVLAPGVAYTAVTDGDNNLNGFDDVNPRVNGSVDFEQDRFSIGASVNVVPDLVSFTQFDDTGRTNSDAVQLTVSANGDLDYRIDSLNDISFGINGRLRTFSENDESLVDNRAIGSSVAWSRTLTPDTRGRLSGSIQYFEADDDENRRSTSYSLRARISTTLSPDLSITASLGASITDQLRDVQTPEGTVTERSTSYTLGPVGDIGFNYALTRDTRFSFNLSQTVDQNSEGRVVNRANVSANLRTQIDERNAVDFGGGFSFQNPVFSGDDDLDASNNQTFSFSPSYVYDLTEVWSVRVGYQFRARQSDDEDIRVSNGVFLTIARNFDFLY